MAHVKFREDSDELVCEKVVEGTDKDPRFSDYGGLACSRRLGHVSPCIAQMREAAVADGVCFSCRQPLGKPHLEDCYNVDAEKEVAT